MSREEFTTAVLFRSEAFGESRFGTEQWMNSEILIAFCQPGKLMIIRLANFQLQHRVESL